MLTTSDCGMDKSEIEALALLREFAALKRYDPNATRGYPRSTLTVNVPKELFERLDEFLKWTKQ